MDQDQLRAALADMAKRGFALNSGGSTTIEDAYRSHMAEHFGVEPMAVDVYYDTEARTLTARMDVTEPIEIRIDAVPVQADPSTVM